MSLTKLSLVTSLFFFIGVACFFLENNKIGAQNRGLLTLSHDRTRHVLTGQVLRPPEPVFGGIRVIVGVIQENLPAANHPLNGRLRLTIRGLLPDALGPGDLIRFSTRLYPVRNFKVPGAFDYESYMALHGIGVTGYLDSPLRMAIVGHWGPGGYLGQFQYIIQKARAALIKRINKAFVDPEQKGLAMALLLGERKWIPEQIRKDFSETGIGHILAVSGLHMALVALMLGFVTKRVLLCSRRLPLLINIRKVSTLLALFGVFLYAALSGFTPSALRAMIMVLAFGFAFLLDRPQTPLNALALSAWILLVINPYYLFSPAFQLSYAAVFFLILFSYKIRSINELFNKKTQLTTYLLALFGAAIIGFSSTLPLGIRYFGGICPIAPFFNVLAVPMVGFFLLPALMIGTLIQLIIPFIGEHIWYLCGQGFSFLCKTSHVLADLPFTWITMPSPSIIQIFLLYIILIFGAVTYKRSIFFLSLLLFISCLILWPLAKYWYLAHNSCMIIHVLDVGQGSCQVIELPKGRLMVVDAGALGRGPFDVGKAIVAPFIRHLGYGKIDVIAITHPQRDHISGLKALVEQFPVDELWTYSWKGRGDDWKGLMKAAKKNEVNHIIWNKDEKLDVFGARIEIFTPTGCTGLKTVNDNGLVFRLSYGGCTALLTGDISEKAEACLLAKGMDKVEVDFLVVPHHGSRSSSSKSFVLATRAKAAVISVGRLNHLVLPSHEILKRYTAIGTRTFRTDIDGTVTFIVKR